MEEREFRSPTRNLGSPMTRSVSGFSNALSGAMSQADEVQRLRKQVGRCVFFYQFLVAYKRSGLIEGESFV